jgi:hypothetical protein
MGPAAEQSAISENSRRAGAEDHLLNTTMPKDIGGECDFRLEIAHVLVIDIVGYSKLLTNEQRERSNASLELGEQIPRVRNTVVNLRPNRFNRCPGVGME